MAVACLTRTYSFRVLVAVFYAPNNARKSELRAPGHLPFTMRVPLGVLAVGSIRRGYVLSDGLIGWGSSFWGSSIVTSPALSTTGAVSRHMIPVWASA